MIPEAAVEAAAKEFAAIADPLGDWETPPDAYRAIYRGRARQILEAAAPYMLSHEREETRLAHLDAVVNARTVDKLNRAIEAVLIGCDAMDAGVRMQSGDQKTTSFAANAIRRSITEELSK